MHKNKLELVKQPEKIKKVDPFPLVVSNAPYRWRI